jgi:hypothetical protein
MGFFLEKGGHSALFQLRPHKLGGHLAGVNLVQLLFSCDLTLLFSFFLSTDV